MPPRRSAAVNDACIKSRISSSEAYAVRRRRRQRVESDSLAVHVLLYTLYAARYERAASL